MHKEFKRRKSIACTCVTPLRPVVGHHERSASCFTIRRSTGALEHGLYRNFSSSSFGTSADITDSTRRMVEKTKDPNFLTAADLEIIDYLKYQYPKDYPVDNIETLDDQLASRKTSVSMAHQFSTPIPFVTLWDVVGPSAWCWVLMVAMIVGDVATAILYHEDEEDELFQWCLIIPHVVCIVLLLERLFTVRGKSGCIFCVVASLWYILTSPLLRFLPLLTLTSSSFDKVLMLSGDPTDTTEFVRRQELHAFNDLVWLGALYCVPMASFQLYALLFTKVSRSEPVILSFQLVSVFCGALLAAVIASTYSFYVRPAATERQSTSQQLLTPIVAQPSAGFMITRTVAWFVTINAKILIVSVLIKLGGLPLAVVIFLVSRLPLIMLTSFVSEITWSLYDILTVSMQSPTYLVAFLKLGSVREVLERPRNSLLHIAASLVEAAAVLLASLLLEAIPVKRVIQLAVVEGAMLFTAALMFLLSQKLLQSKSASPKI